MSGKTRSSFVVVGPNSRLKRAQLQALRREFELLTMKDAKTID